MSGFSVKRYAEGGSVEDDELGYDYDTPDEDALDVAASLGDASPADINAYYAKLFANQGERRKLISEAAERLRQQRAPSMWGALSEGLAQPKTQPGLSGTLANISSGLSAYRKEKTAFDNAQADKLMAYRLKGLELEGETGKAQSDLAYRLAALKAAQEKAEADRNRATIHEVDGSLVDDKGTVVYKGSPRLTADQSTRMGYAKSLFPKLTEAEIIAQNLLYDPRVDKQLTRLYAGRTYAGAYAGAAAREPFEEPPVVQETKQYSNGKTAYKIRGVWYDNPRGE